MVFLWIANARADSTGGAILDCTGAASYVDVIQVTAPSRKGFGVFAHDVKTEGVSEKSAAKCRGRFEVYTTRADAGKPQSDIVSF